MKNRCGYIITTLCIALTLMTIALAQSSTPHYTIEYEPTRHGKGKLNIKDIAYSPDGTMLAVATDTEGALVYNVLTGVELHQFKTQSDSVCSVEFHPDGKILATGSWGADKNIHLYDLTTGQIHLTYTGYYAWCLSFSPDGKMLASVGWDNNSIRLWDTDTGENIRTLYGHSDKVWDVLFSPDGNLLASRSDDRTIRLWDMNTGEQHKKLAIHNRKIIQKGIAFSPDGRAISACQGLLGMIHTWDVKTGQPLRKLMPERIFNGGVAYSPDGKTIISGFFSNIDRWDAETGEYLGEFKNVSEMQGGVGLHTVAFSPNGLTFASVNSQEVHIWNATTGKYLRRLISRY